MKSRLAFLVGAERSGTTWLWRTLAGHPEILGIPETHLFAMGERPSESTVRRFLNTPFWRSLQNPRDAFHQKCESWSAKWPEARSLLGLQELVDAGQPWAEIAAELFARVDGIRPWILEKTPGHVFRMQEIRARFPEAHFVGILRDGRDVLTSLRALDQEWVKPHQAVASAAMRWGRAVSALLQAQRQWPEQVVLVRYEDLLADFPTSLGKILGFLGVDRGPALLEDLCRRNTFESYTRRPRGEAVDGAFFRRGTAGDFRQDLSAEEIREYERRVGPILEKLGYELVAARSASVAALPVAKSEPSAALSGAESIAVRGAAIGPEPSPAGAEGDAGKLTHLTDAEERIAARLEAFQGSDDNQRQYFAVHRRRYAQTLARIPPAAPGQKLLELGCSFHHMTAYLELELGYEVSCHGFAGGTERREVRPDDGTRGVSVPVHSFDLERDAYPYADGSFDVVVCCEILEHLLVDPMHMMVEIHRVLKPGGHLLLTTPNATCTHSVQAALEGKSPHVYGHYEVGGEPTDRHNREYTPGEVRALLENSGMQVHRLETVESWWRTDREILEFLGEHGYDTALRHDNTLAWAERAAPIKKRYPREFYLQKGAQQRWRTRVNGAAPAAPATAAPLNLLVVHEHVPQYDRSGADTRLLEILEALRGQGHFVTLLARDSEGEERFRPRLDALGVELIAGDHARVRWYKNHQGTCVDIPSVLRGEAFDAALLCHWFWRGISVAEQYVPLLRKESPETRVIVLTDDVHWLREQRLAEVSGRRLDRERSRGMRARELAVYRSADLVLCISEEDARRIQGDVPGVDLGLLRHCCAPGPERVPGFAERSGLLFLGSGKNGANVDAVAWLEAEILPRIRRELPDVPCTVVGEPAGAHWPGGPQGIRYVGARDDLAPWMGSARVFVAPVRYGTGIKTKNVLALAHGLPLVTTPVGGEGMKLTEGENVLLRGDAAGLAQAVVAAYTDAELWERLSRGGRAHAAEHFSRTGLVHDLESCWKRAANLLPHRDRGVACPALAVDDQFPAALQAPLAERLLQRCNARVSRASAHLRQGEIPEALLELQSVLLEVRLPGDWVGFAPVFYSLAAVYLKAGQGSDALACVREAIRLQPEFEDARALEQKVLAGLE